MQTNLDHWDHMGSCWEVSHRGFPPQFIRRDMFYPLDTTICVKEVAPEMQVAFLQLLPYFLGQQYPNLFSTRDQFHGRQFFHGWGGVEWFQNDSSSLPLCALLFLTQCHCWSDRKYWSAAYSLGTPVLGDMPEENQPLEMGRRKIRKVSV